MLRDLCFWYIYIELIWTTNLSEKKSQLDSKATNPNFNLKSILDAKIIPIKNKQTYQTQFYISRVNSSCSNHDIKPK